MSFILGQDVIVKDTGKRAQIQGIVEYLYSEKEYCCVYYEEENNSEWKKQDEIKKLIGLRAIK